MIQNVASQSGLILIVDDEQDNLDVLERRLCVRRLNVVTAKSGQEALDIINSQRVDLVLLDVMMPGMSGTEVLAKIRGSHCPSALPVIMVTARDDRLTTLSSISGGANDYVTKPFDFEVLLARIMVQLNVRTSFRTLVAEHSRLQRRLELRARLEEQGFGDPEKRLHLLNEFHRGMSEGHVQLQYQPQFHFHNQAIDSAEALMRWNSPSLGQIPPDQFISLAEEAGEIGALTKWAVTKAIEDHTRFAQAGHALRISVNLSAQLAGDTEFIDQLRDLLADKTDAISLELTESAIMDNPETAVENLSRLAEAGIRVSIDDYGTGMSSLFYLQTLPAHELKIDRRFISKLTSSRRDPVLVRSTIELAHALDLEVIAEGVEDVETHALLRAMGCDAVQGYFVGRPMGADEFIAYLGDEASRAALSAPSSQRLLMDAVAAQHSLTA